MLKRRNVLLAAGAATALPTWAQGQGFPTKPIRILCATVAGSGPDVATRRMAQILSDILKQPVVVENRPGANGIIAASELMKAPRDGYTMLNGNIGNALNDVVRPQQGPKINEDLIPITDLMFAPLILLVNSSLPIRNAKEFIDYAKANPTALNYGSGGAGTLVQLTAERLKLATNIQMREVTYKSLGADIMDLIAGHVQVGFTVWSIIEGHVKAGKVRAIAIAHDQRMTVPSDVPTFAEAGLTNITATGWNGMFAPAGTPPDVVDTLGRAMSAAVRRADYREFFARDGTEVGGKTPEQFSGFIRAEQDRYRDIIQRANIKLS